MKFIDFKEKLKEFVVFNLNDIRKIETDFDLRRLSEWTKKGYIEKVRRGYYVFSDLVKNEQALYIIANNIYKPSYVSLETAFSLYGIIPESVYSIISVTSLKTNSFDAGFAVFKYRQLQSDLFFGYELINYNNYCYMLADLEKSLLDYFYLNPHVDTINDIKGLRFNTFDLREKLDIGKLKKYLSVFDSKELSSRVNKFLIYIKNA